MDVSVNTNIVRKLLIHVDNDGMFTKAEVLIIVTSSIMIDKEPVFVQEIATEQLKMDRPADEALREAGDYAERDAKERVDNKVKFIVDLVKVAKEQGYIIEIVKPKIAENSNYIPDDDLEEDFEEEDFEWEEEW